ncbi:MAG: peptidyl-prolyl cis-trans isomerase [Candidatus Omnitrophota bacterium]
MSNSAKKSGFGVFLFSALIIAFSTLSIGCDKINFLSPKKTSTDKASSGTAAVKGTVIAKVDNTPITLEELSRYIDIYNASLDLRQDLTPDQKKAEKIDTRDKKINYLKELLVRQTVFYQAAIDKGLDRKPEVSDMMDRYKMALLAQEMQSDIVKNIEVSSAEVEEAYKNNQNLFKEPESRKVREIASTTENDAKQILVELLQGADFANIARSRSIADSAKTGGDMGYIKRGQKGEKFANYDDVAFSSALQEGSISSVFKGTDGYYYIVKVEDIKEGKQVSLSEAWDTIKALLLARKQKEELDKSYSQLNREHKIEIYEGEIK